jgi:D-glycero-D-manno-heptose 1,7-bisphosphate phosphatase
VTRSRRAPVFLDRDGTINREVEGALARLDQLELLPGAAAAIARLNRAGHPVVVVSNQSATARGWQDHASLWAVQSELERRLALEGARVDAWFTCPHHPTAGSPPYRRVCACRKPAPGLVDLAARRLGLDLEGGWIVGDAERDLLAGAARGLRTILVATGKGAAQHERMLAANAPPQHFVPDLAAAVATILAAEREA